MCFHFASDPFSKEYLWDELQTHIFKMDAATLEEIFEINSIEDELEHELEQLEAALEKLHNDDMQLHRLAPHLAP